MKLWRVVPLDQNAGPEDPGGPLWIPRHLQGVGRHDNPELYGCLYATERPVSAIAEQLAPFRGTGHLIDAMLRKFDLPLVLVELRLQEDMKLVDLDDPAVLGAERLRPSQVATRRRQATQAQAARIYVDHPEATGIRWWSTLEASWINLTIFDRGRGRLELEETTILETGGPLVLEAAVFLGLQAPSGQ